MGLLRRRSRQTPTNQTESISGFYSGVKKADADSAAPMIEHHERAEYLAVRVIVTYRDGDWWLSWNQIGIRARETAEAARLLAETMTRTLPDTPPNPPGSA
jgi:hypothetical protein